MVEWLRTWNVRNVIPFILLWPALCDDAPVWQCQHSAFGTKHSNYIYNVNICSSLASRVQYSPRQMCCLSAYKSLFCPLLPFSSPIFFCLPFRTSIFGCELFVLRVQMKLRMNGNYNNYQTVSPANAAVQHPLIQLDWDNNAKQRRMAFCLLIPPLTFGTGINIEFKLVSKIYERSVCFTIVFSLSKRALFGARIELKALSECSFCAPYGENHHHSIGSHLKSELKTQEKLPLYRLLQPARNEGRQQRKFNFTFVPWPMFFCKILMSFRRLTLSLYLQPKNIH